MILRTNPFSGQLRRKILDLHPKVPAASFAQLRKEVAVELVVVPPKPSPGVDIDLVVHFVVHLGAQGIWYIEAQCVPSCID